MGRTPRRTSNTSTVTSADVAKLAGVSRATVSRVMNPSASVSEALTKRVMDAAKALGYTPNAIARSLSSAKTGIIGVVSIASTDYYCKSILHLSQQLQSQGYQTLLFPVSEAEHINSVMPRILQYRLDGLLITGTTLDSSLQESCTQNGIPVVLFGRSTKDTTCCVIACDNRAAGALAADRFLDQKRDQLACIYAGHHVSTSLERLQGFVEEAKRRGADQFLSTISTDGTLTYAAGKRCTLSLFKGRKRPNAIFCVNTDVAMGCMDALRYDLHLRVPEDVCVIGFDDSDIAAGSAYGLTTLVQPQQEMISAAVETLIAQINTPDAPCSVQLFPAELQLRTSA